MFCVFAQSNRTGALADIILIWNVKSRHIGSFVVLPCVIYLYIDLPVLNVDMCTRSYSFFTILFLRDFSEELFEALFKWWRDAKFQVVQIDCNIRFLGQFYILRKLVFWIHPQRREAVLVDAVRIVANEAWDWFKRSYHAILRN